jgi:hypothetical protein
MMMVVFWEAASRPSQGGEAQPLKALGMFLWAMRGGVLAAPFIGVMVGLCSGSFRHAGFGGRLTIAAFSLYASAFLFVLASGLVGTLSKGSSITIATALFNSVAFTFGILTWSGFFVILVPLAYFNHLYLARSPASLQEGKTAG